jgi:type III secretion protein Q
MTGTWTRGALPLELDRVSRAFAAIRPRMRVEAARLSTVAAEALSEALAVPVAIRASVSPALPERLAGVARVLVPLSAIGGGAVIEVDLGTLGDLLERLAGRASRRTPALVAREAEAAALTFCALVVVDAGRSCGLAPLAPCVALEEPSPSPQGHLAIQLDLTIGARSGWGRLLVPPGALDAIAAPPELPADVSRLVVHASLRDATTTLTPDELAALSAGDVLLLDPGPAVADLVFPGGLTFRGRVTGGVHHIEEIRMTEPQSAYPIVLSVEIARVRVTLSDLARLAPGAALPLDVRKDGAVVLRAGEDVIARGTLVDVEGTLGVRVAQVGALP